MSTLKANPVKSDLQEDNRLVLRTRSKSSPGFVGQFLGAAHGTTFLAAIGTLGRRTVRVEGDQGMRREEGSRVAGVKSTGEMCSEMGIGLKMCWEGGQRGL
jgi:hypothetical protein